jgi:ABC-type branched-subunit amino acid transport system substrate-binding protein
MIKADTRLARVFAILVIGSLVVLLPALVAAQDLTLEEERGREIYLHGVSPSGGTITAQFGKDGPQLPASSVPCANCHGRDGRGRSEGGVVPSDLRWFQLTRETPAGNGTFRSRPAYTDRWLTRAFTMGLDSGGTSLNPVMPRYRFLDSDAHDLIAYLKTLGVKPEPGVSNSSVRVGVVLPPKGFASPELARAVREELPNGPAQKGKAVQDFVKARGIFALVAGFVAGSEQEVVSTLGDLGVPLVMGITPSPLTATDRYAFFFDGGISSQAEALANYAISAHSGDPPKILVLYSQGGVEQQAAEAACEQFRAKGWTTVERIAMTGDSDLAKLRGSHPEIVMLLSRNVSFRELAAWPKTVFLVPGLLLAPDIVASPLPAGSRIFAAFPILPSDFGEQALAEYQALAKKYHVHSGDLQAQLAALSGAKVFLEALRRSGRDLSREKLVEVEEGLQAFQTGWTPPFTFAPNQHIGIPIPRVVEVDPRNHRFVPVQ